MADSNAQSSPPVLLPQHLKHFIELVASDDKAFHDFFTQRFEQTKDYRKVGKLTSFAIPGSFNQYFLGIQYLLHDERLKNLYEQHYKYLKNPDQLKFVCGELLKRDELMVDLGKGRLFELEDQKKVEAILEENIPAEQKEEKIEESLSRAVQKKEESKLAIPKITIDTERSAPPAQIPDTQEPTIVNPIGEQIAEVTTTATPIIPTAPVLQKIENPLSFRLQQFRRAVQPTSTRILNRIGSAGAIFYRRHPITARAAIGAATLGVTSVVFNWPYNPASGLIVGALSGELIARGVQAINPASRPEPGELQDTEDRDSGLSLPTPGGRAGRSGFTFPGNSLFNRARGLQKAAQAAKGLRTAAMAARLAPLLANPVFWIVVVILILLLIVFLLIILPTTSLLPPFETFPAGRNPADQVQIIKSGPKEVGNGEKIQYKITVTNKGTNSASAEITDTIPNGTEYVDSNPKGTVSGNTVKWSITNIQSSSPKVLTLDVQPIQNDMWIMNEVSATIKAGATPGSGPVAGSGCPDTAANRDGFNCKYLNPSIGLFDTNISEEGKDRYINTYGSRFVNAGKGDIGEFRKRVEYIIQQSQEAGLNPAIFLGLWRSENAFGTLGPREFGCAGDGFYEELHCALGIKEFSNPVKNPISNCARSKDANSQACKALREGREKNGQDTDHPIQYPIATFDDFAEAHGPYGHLTGGLPTNCTNTYNILLDVAKEIGMCKPQATTPTAPGGSATPGSAGFSLSCPIEVAQISCGTAENPTASCGHGGLGYGVCSAPPYAVCPYSPQLRKAIDVIPAKGGNAPVYAPFINGTESIEWTRVQDPIAINGGTWGYKVLYKATHQGKELILDLTHINAVIAPYATVKSGEPIGTVYPHTDNNGIGHLHTAISVNGAWIEAVKEAKMCGN